MKNIKKENYNKMAEQMPIEDKITASILVNLTDGVITFKDVVVLDMLKLANQFINKYPWVLTKEGFEAIKPFKSLDNI